MKIKNLLIPVFLSPAAINAENLPNIVFVLVDDMGIGDINCYYSQPKIQTPNIDKLASKSLQFMQHYSGSTVSAPSRCCLLTGKHTGNAKNYLFAHADEETQKYLEAVRLGKNPEIP